MAVLGRKSSMEESKDYRGVDVVSVFQAIPDSPWFMVAKVDAAEVFANWQLRASNDPDADNKPHYNGRRVGVDLFGSAVKKLLYSVLRQSKESLQESEEYLSATLRSIGDGVITWRFRRQYNKPKLRGRNAYWMERRRVPGMANARSFPHNQFSETRQEAENLVSQTLRENRIIGMANQYRANRPRRNPAPDRRQLRAHSRQR